jgi:hypothetical protein
VDGHERMIVISTDELGAAESTIRVKAVDHVHAMSTPGELVRKAMHEDRIATETVRGIERGYHAEAQ